MKNALSELLPRKARAALYVVAMTLLTALTAWQASNGDWVTAGVTFLTNIAPGLALANLTPDQPEVPIDPEGRLF